MRRLGLLPILVLAGQRVLAAVPDDDPMHGCKVTSGGPPTVHLACGLDVLDVTDAAPGERGDAFNEGMIVGLKQGSKQPVEQIEFSIELDGVKHRAVRLISGGRFQWVLVTLGRSEGQRTIMCREALHAESRCHPWIEAAARWEWRAGPPASVPRDLRVPEVAGRPFQVPQGCGFVESAGGWTVTCSDHSGLIWAESPRAGSLDVEPIIASFRKLATSEKTVDCSVEGVPTKCWNGTTSEQGPGVHVSYAATVRGKQLIVVCLQGAVRSGLPPPCRSVLTLPIP